LPTEITDDTAAWRADGGLADHGQVVAGTPLLFRRRDMRGVGSWVDRLMPEIGQRYPSNRFDAAKAHVSRGFGR
jgi:hypothetical protein